MTVILIVIIMNQIILITKPFLLVVLLGCFIEKTIPMIVSPGANRNTPNIAMPALYKTPLLLVEFTLTKIPPTIIATIWITILAGTHKEGLFMNSFNMVFIIQNNSITYV